MHISIHDLHPIKLHKYFTLSLFKKKEKSKETIIVEKLLIKKYSTYLVSHR